ncbi:MAG: phosphatidate cytidylyltransferase [Bacteroidales bacterium]|nr:phosphatidate cytidylyltransferase [Bacteroidales bacterium]
MSNLVLRALTGAIIVSAIIASIIFGKFYFGALFFIFTILGTHEFFKMIEKSDIIAQKTFGTAVAGALYLLLWWVSYEPFNPQDPVNTATTQRAMYLVIIVLFVFVIPIRELYRTDSDQPIQNIATTLLGIVYVAVPFGLMNFMFRYNGEKTFHLILGLFVILWTADTFAYLVGSRIGKNRLFERISPKKSWEGSIGGLIAALIAAAIFSFFFKEMSLILWLGYAIIITVAGAYGDLVESMFKRSLNIKDSGNILPGHGGILDRFDAVFLAVPAAIIYLMFIS